MSKASKGLICGFLFVLAVSGCIVGYQLYQQHHLSSDLKRTLTAAVDPSTSEGDVRSYIRDARLQVHTKKDEEILRSFQTAVQLAEDSSEISNRLYNETLRSLESAVSGEDDATFNRLIDLRSEYWKSHIPVPKDLKTDIDQALAQIKARHRQEQEEHDAEDKRAKSEADTAKKLYNNVRSELGLPRLAN